MRLVPMATTICAAASAVIQHAATRSFGWHAPVITCLAGALIHAMVIAEERSTVRAQREREIYDLRTGSQGKLSAEEAAVVQAMRDDQRRALR